MKLQLIGVNHNSAPVEVRERLAIPEWRLAEACRQLAEHPGVEEGMILSTCNRVELIAHLKNGSGDLRAFLRDYFQLDLNQFERHLYEYREQDAIRHVFRVAASLDSMVLGEPQILGQVKEAYATARAVGAVRAQLDQFLTRAFAVAKRVRTETAVGSSSVSIASVAVELAKKIFGSLNGKSVYLVGAGKMSELAARHLLAHGATSIFVANRTYDRAIRLAQKFDGQAIEFRRLYDSCERADIVITSTGSPKFIFRPEHGEKLMALRRNRPMFFIDIAVPRDVDPALNKLDGIFVYDIDDLQQAVSSHVADRKKEADKAEAIVDGEVEKFQARLQSLDVVPTIVSLQDHLETIRQAEIDRVRGRLGSMTADQELAVEALTRGIVNKIMHTPISTLKTAARDPESTTVIDLVRARGHTVEIEVIKTTGDKITDVALAKVGTKGMFTKEIEEALVENRVDLAVHSLKDLPTELAADFEIAAITTRENPRDVFCSVKFASIEALPLRARVGTSSLRRQAQLKVLRPDLQIHPLRGNVDTRLHKLEAGDYDAIILAAAGLNRLGKTQLVRQVIPVEVMTPAAGQGALAIEIRHGDTATRALLAFLDDGAARATTTCERALLKKLGGGCQVPIGALAEVNGSRIRLNALVAHPDGTKVLRETGEGDDPVRLGEEVGETLLRRGGDIILEEVYGEGFALPQQP